MNSRRLTLAGIGGILLSLMVLPVAHAQEASSPDKMDALRSELSSLKSSYTPDDAYIQGAVDTARKQAEGAMSDIRGHLVTVVDRATNKQNLMIFLVSDDGQDWEMLYTGHVSTGKPGRREHFKTPTGVFLLDGSIMDYRAQGTFNQNHIRGIGLKGSRVWDFGWQDTEDWRTKGATMQIRMEMHATDPANLELRIGHPDSEGCIRIHADINRVMDRYGVLDAAPNEMAINGSEGWSQLLGKQHVYLPEAGKYVIIIDTKETV